MSKAWIIIVAVVVLVFVVSIATHNGIVSKQEQIDSSWAQVETVLQRRYDLIPNLVSTVKGYATHEKELLENVTKLRSQWAGAGNVGDKAKAASALEGALGRLMVVVERYPDLKANQNFLALQDQLEGSENRISIERRRYNEAIKRYNVAIRRFPGNILASLGGFEKSTACFKSEAAAQQAPKVQF